MSDAVALRAARPTDLGEIVALERASYSHPWSEASLEEAVADARRFQVLVLRSATNDAAPELRGYCIFQVVADEIQIHNVTVAPEHRRAGFARRMLARAFEMGIAAGARQALLEVRESNGAGRALYASLGFDEVGHRRGYYTSPVEDALLLRKALS